MAMPILSDELGSVIDLNQGFKDISEKRLRVLHPRSFLDDCTRIFRAVRYSTRLGFAIEDETKALLMEGIKEINSVSGTRILNEIIRICDESERIEILKTLNSLEIFKIIHPKMYFPVELEKVSKNGDIKNWSRTEISCLLLYSSPPEHWEAIAHSLDMPKSVLAALSGLRILANLDDDNLNSDIYQNLISVPEAALRVGLSCLDDTKSTQIKLFVDHLRDLQLSINGDDVMSLGVQPGPLVGELLSQAFSALLNDQLQGRESQLSFVQNLIR
jgi:tRNA nucleotidyltransferase/poly(A) polymerase